jgi:MFS family permease
MSLVKFDREAEARLCWKIDLAVVPLASVLFLMSFIDRANIGWLNAASSHGNVPAADHPVSGNARTAGLEHDLGMAGTDYNAVNSLLYVGYLVFEFPSTITCKMIGPEWFLPVIYIAMGLVSIGHGYVHNYAQLSGVRFLLGVLEAGGMPGTAYYVVSLRHLGDH